MKLPNRCGGTPCGRRIVRRLEPRTGSTTLMSMLHARATAVMALLAAAHVAATPVSAQRADTTSTKAWLLAADRALAADVAARGAGALIDALSADAAVLIPGSPILRGHDADQPYLARYGGGARHGWHVLAAVASSDPAFGCTTGRATFVSASDTAHRERGGQYLMCWRRGPNGRAQVVGLQRDDAPPGAPLPAAGYDGGPMPRSATRSSARDALAAAQDADAAFAAQGGTVAGPAEAFAAYVAADGLFPGATDSLRGVAMVRAAFGPRPSGRVLLWAPTRSAGYAAGGLAFTVGEATNKLATSDEGLSKSKYFTVWRLEADGTWKWIFDLGSPRP